MTDLTYCALAIAILLRCWIVYRRWRADRQIGAEVLARRGFRELKRGRWVRP